MVGAPRLYLSSTLLLLRTFYFACFRDVVVVAYGCLAIAPPFQLYAQASIPFNASVPFLVHLCFVVCRTLAIPTCQAVPVVFPVLPAHHQQQRAVGFFYGPLRLRTWRVLHCGCGWLLQQRRYCGVHMSMCPSDVCSFGLGCCVQSCVRRDPGNHLFRTFVFGVASR